MVLFFGYLDPETIFLENGKNWGDLTDSSAMNEPLKVCIVLPNSIQTMWCFSHMVKMGQRVEFEKMFVDVKNFTKFKQKIVDNFPLCRQLSLMSVQCDQCITIIPGRCLHTS